MSEPTKYCLCSDPDYCLRGTTPQDRGLAIAYRKVHGAPLPIEQPEEGVAESGHTPGPWIHKGNAVFAYPHRNALPATCITVSNSHNGFDVDTDADLTLIAQAPDLLARALAAEQRAKKAEAKVSGLREAFEKPPGVRPDGPQTELHITFGAWQQYLDTGDECFTANMRPDGMRELLCYFAAALAALAEPDGR